jgi:hypothetical protein
MYQSVFFDPVGPHVCLSEISNVLCEIIEIPRFVQLFITIDVQNPPGKSGSAAAMTWKRTTAPPVMPQIPWSPGWGRRGADGGAMARRAPWGVGVGSMKPWLNHSTLVLESLSNRFFHQV